MCDAHCLSLLFRKTHGRVMCCDRLEQIPKKRFDSRIKLRRTTSCVSFCISLANFAA